MRSYEYRRSPPNIKSCQLQSACFRAKPTNRLQALLERVFDENKRGARSVGTQSTLGHLAFIEPWSEPNMGYATFVKAT
jgi:hypothetical protein